MNTTTKVKIPTGKDIALMAKQLLNAMPTLKVKIDPVAEEASVTTQSLFAEVIKFLYLVAAYDRSLSPPMVGDLAWHEFILCTRLYTQFCEDRFGKYIHHTPGGEREDNHTKFVKTIQLYLISFGEPPKEVWGDFAHNEWLESQCGTCKTD